MNFDEAYKNLNVAQKKAVDTIDGPVLVIAGPGTGKTQLLSTRVANILKKTDTDARSILCLTFTNKAATNMRERLQKLTDGEAAHVHVKTFHSFASEIMNNYGQYFWNGANLTSAPDAAQLAILESIFEKLPLDNPYASKFYGTYTMLSKAQKAIARTKEAGLTPEKLRVLLQANLAYIDEIEADFVDALEGTLSHKKLGKLQAAVHALPQQKTDLVTAPLIGLDTKIKESLDYAVGLDLPTNKATHTSNWKKNWLTKEGDAKGLHKERRRNTEWLHLADIYEEYRDQLHQRGFYDYSDMLLEVIVQIEQHEDLRAEIQERFNYVLIDEFQDSNSAQLRLAHLVADHPSAEGKPNIMAVGDDDQSIYGFNGAELNNMLHFERTYGNENVVTIVLEENYRSTKEVLAAAESIIACSEDRLVHRLPNLTKKLIARATDLPKGEITHNRYLTKEHQQYMVAYEIQNYKQQNPEHSVAVLARSHKSLEPLAEQLNNLEVPLHYERQQNVLEQEVVLQIINICQAIESINTGDEEKLNVVLSQLLRHPMFGVDGELLWFIAKENRFDPQWFSSLLEHPKTRPLGEWLQWLAAQAQYQPLPLLLEYIIGIKEDSPQSYIRDYFVHDQQLSNIYLETLAAIRILRDMASEFTLSNKPKLAEFLQFISTEQANKKVIANSFGLKDDTRAVDLLSVHKAKGLEFDAVYIIDAVEKDWQPSGNRHGVPANLPLNAPLETEDEYARLMYVAATRAKHTLIFTSYKHNTAGEEVLPTPLLQAFEPIDAPRPDTDQSMAILEHALTWPRLKTTAEKEVLAPIIENFTINATNLINFLDVTEGGPATFLERSLLRLPEAKSDSMSHGTAMHAALEFAQKQFNLGSFDLSAVKAEYRRTLIKEHVPAERLPLQIEQGEKNIDRLFKDFDYQLIKGSQPEQSLKDLYAYDARIGGKLDRIDFVNKETLRIVDYKTGSGLHSLFTKDKNKTVKAWKHKLQLTFYALLARKHPEYSVFKNIEGQMVYVESSDLKFLKLSYQPTLEEVEQLEKLIKVVWRHIKNYDLPDTSHYEQNMNGVEQFISDLLAEG